MPAICFVYRAIHDTCTLGSVCAQSILLQQTHAVVVIMPLMALSLKQVSLVTVHRRSSDADRKLSTSRSEHGPVTQCRHIRSLCAI